MHLSNLIMWIIFGVLNALAFLPLFKRMLSNPETRGMAASLGLGGVAIVCFIVFWFSKWSCTFLSVSDDDGFLGMMCLVLLMFNLCLPIVLLLIVGMGHRYGTSDTVYAPDFPQEIAFQNFQKELQEAKKRRGKNKDISINNKK